MFNILFQLMFILFLVIFKILVLTNNITLVPGMEISTRHQPNAGDFVLWRVNSLHLPATVAGK